MRCGWWNPWLTLVVIAFLVKEGTPDSLGCLLVEDFSYWLRTRLSVISEAGVLQ